jgi:hypothetical protein
MHQQGGTMLRTTVKILLSILLIAGTAGVFGCAQQTAAKKQSRLDQNWGRSYETALYNQILNPEAGKNIEPVEGLEGPAAERVIKEHYSADSCDSTASIK